MKKLSTIKYTRIDPPSTTVEVKLAPLLYLKYDAARMRRSRIITTRIFSFKLSYLFYYVSKI